MKKNPIAKDLRTDKYKPRVVPDKKKEATKLTKEEIDEILDEIARLDQEMGLI